MVQLSYATTGDTCLQKYASISHPSSPIPHVSHIYHTLHTWYQPYTPRSMCSTWSGRTTPSTTARYAACGTQQYRAVHVDGSLNLALQCLRTSSMQLSGTVANTAGAWHTGGGGKSAGGTLLLHDRILHSIKCSTAIGLHHRVYCTAVLLYKGDSHLQGAGSLAS